MRSIIIILILISPITSSGQTKKLKVNLNHDIKCVQASYSLVFNDEFDGNSLDTSKWFAFYPYGPEYAPDSCAFCRTHVSANIFRDENVTVKNNLLYLKSEQTGGTWFNTNYNYTSGMVHSKQKFTTYGKYEVRCKLPKGKQQWPAFWVFGWNTEIDIFEFICNGPEKIEFSVHNWLTNDCPNKNPKKGSPCYSSQSKMVDFGIDFSEDFHTFSVEYEPTMIKYYIDDIMVRYIPKYYDLKGNPINTCNIKSGEYLTEPAFPHYGEPVQVIANQSICHKHKEKNPVFPNVMEIDYIRVYQKDIQQDLVKPLKYIK
ncbi:MAG: glycoside hydrolase family 16 protein [Saprospiraceae bacterium]|jgi:beta-glucanase (GH16 family)|nr:glycoside hydrolase family 16 protein [Saprospiraceae bacterium]MBL0027245.1 glycoside hydrolase family 16 protein [Saprospiraceae bacterium]